MDQKFDFKKLDEKTRKFMLQGIALAEKSDNIYFSLRFNEIGLKNWVNLLKQAARDHDERWLAHQLEVIGALRELETKSKPKGGQTIAHVPDRAVETLADGQFNRFYMIAICLRALEEGKTCVMIYRAKQRSTTRQESVKLVGTSRDINSLLQELRIKELSLKCEILKPNSGLSIDY